MSSRSWLNFRRSESEAARHAGDTTVRGKIRTIRVARNLQVPKLRGSFASSRLALDDHQQLMCPAALVPFLGRTPAPVRTFRKRGTRGDWSDRGPCSARRAPFELSGRRGTCRAYPRESR